MSAAAGAPRAVAAVCLDAHGTLLELPSPVEPLRAALAQRFGVQVSVDATREAFIAEVRYYRTHLLDGRDAASLAALRLRCAEVLRAALPRSAELARVPPGELAEVLVQSLHFRTFPDVLPTLRALRAAGVRLAVASNWDASLGELLERLGVAAELDGVFTSAAVGAAKPDPAVIRAALRAMDADPARAMHVGDVYGEDVVGARRAGVEPVLLVRDRTGAGAARASRRGAGHGDPTDPEVRTIRTLGQLRNLVSRAE